MGVIEKAFAGWKELEEGLKEKEERRRDRRKAWCASCLETALRHMLLSSRGERGGWGKNWRREGEAGVVELLSSLPVSVPGYCLFTAMADI